MGKNIHLLQKVWKYFIFHEKVCLKELCKRCYVYTAIQMFVVNCLVKSIDFDSSVLRCNFKTYLFTCALTCDLYILVIICCDLWITSLSHISLPITSRFL